MTKKFPSIARAVLALSLLCGLGAPALAAITASPNVLNFSQPVGAQAPQQAITVVNNSGIPVSFTGVQINPSGIFNLGPGGSNCFAAPVPNGGTCFVNVVPLPRTSPGTFVASFAMSTLQFPGDPSIANASLNLLVTPAGGSSISSPGIARSVSPQQVALNSGRSTQMLSYTFLGNPAAPIAGYLCTQLLLNPPGGASTTNPCAPGAQSQALHIESGGYTTQPQVGTLGRAVETVSFPEAVSRLSISKARQTGDPSIYFIREFEGGSYAVVQLQAVGSTLAEPLTFTDVRLAFRTGGGRQPSVSLAPGQAVPPSFAELYYTGSGTLRGRWEVVEPGQPVPTPADLVPEASVAFAQRGQQQRYRLIERFEYALGPNGRFELPGPDPARLPVRQTGGYLILLRIEAVPTRQPGGATAEHGGAPFSLPVLIYQVGPGIDSSTALASRFVRLVNPPASGGSRTPALAWAPVPEARSWRVELADAQGVVVGSKFLRAEETSYRLTGALARQVRGKATRWRVQAFDAGRRPIGRSDWKDLG